MSHSVLGPQHHEQLKMFMTKEEIGDMTSGDFFPYKVHEAADRIGNRDKMAGAILGEPSYIDKMSRTISEQGGVHTPVAVLRNNLLVNGHHRWAAAPAGSLLPVIHGEDMDPLLQNSWDVEGKNRGRKV